MRALKLDVRRYVNIYKIEEVKHYGTVVKYAFYEDGDKVGAAPLFSSFELDPMEKVWSN